MRILFICRRFSYLKNFEGPILELARRGHDLHLVGLANEGKLAGTSLMQRWADSNPRITFERFPAPPREDLKAGLRSRISMMVNYMRYLEPAYRSADGLLERAVRRTPVGLAHVLERPAARLLPVRRSITWALDRLERATPRRPELGEFLRAQAPDVVLFTPLITLQSEEQDLLTAAAEQGLRTVFCVLSWDNLSSKAIIRTMPDMVTVWNDTQRDEAHQLHGVPLDRIAVTGAQTFDHWFDRAPSRSREAFAGRVGLPAHPTYLLWVCSALFRTSPIEAEFVKRWIQAIRASSDPLLREVPILVRPHPTRMLEWNRVPLDGLGPVSLWGSNPIETEAKDDYFDSLYYSAAVAGLNTSAFLEAAIVGRPVYTVLLPEFRESQVATLHFPYLLNVAGGLLHASSDMEAHLADLAGALRHPSQVADRSRRFVRVFIRPGGLETSATSLFVGAIEALASRPAPQPIRSTTLVAPLFRGIYRWLEGRSDRGAVKEWLISPNEIELGARREVKAAKARARELREAMKAERARAKEASRAERLRAKEARALRHADKADVRAREKESVRAEKLRVKQEALARHRQAKKRMRKAQNAVEPPQ